MTKVRALLVTVLAFISLVLLVVTAVVPKWIEEFFGAEPDAGSGSAEALIVFVALTVVSGLGAIVAWRKVATRVLERTTSDRRLS